MNPRLIDSAVSSSSLLDAKLEEHRASCRSTQCPSCGHKLLDRKSVWVGLPAGVKFDPTDQELIDHLEAKVKAQDLRSHPRIDEFIPTIEGEDGICYTHPEKLPGVTRDGRSRHFFHRPSKAYTTGTRKRRKIQSESKGETRWHKTGKTRPVMVNGQHKGCKKILVLYTNFGKHRKPEKTNWVMHQYHLGQAEEERDGEMVVSKIFYQTQPRYCTAASAAAASVLQRGIMLQQQNASSARGGSGSYSGSSKELGIGKISDEKLPSGYSGILGMPDNVIMKTDNISFAPFRQTFSQVAMDEHVADVRTLHYNYHHHHLAQVDQQQQQPVANFHTIGRTMNSVSSLISSAELQQTTPMALDDPYHVPGSILQEHDQQRQKLEHRSAAGLEELIVSCTTAGIKGEETSVPQSQATQWQYPYWPAHNQEHDRHPGQSVRRQKRKL